MGSENVFRDVAYKDGTTSIAQFISDLDHALQSLLHSIEKFAFNIDAEQQIFSPGELIRVPIDQGPEVFAETLHSNYLKMIDYISRINEEDLNVQLVHPSIEQQLEVGWYVQFSTLYEQSVTTGIQTVMQYNGVDVHVPWAMSKFMRPVKKLRLK